MAASVVTPDSAVLETFVLLGGACKKFRLKTRLLLHASPPFSPTTTVSTEL